jgi:hypothetical protein
VSDYGHIGERRATFNDDQASEVGIRTSGREPSFRINGLTNQSGQSLPSPGAARQDHQQARIRLHCDPLFAPLSDDFQLVRFVCGNHDVGTS